MKKSEMIDLIEMNLPTDRETAEQVIYLAEYFGMLPPLDADSIISYEGDEIPEFLELTIKDHKWAEE